MKIDSLIVPIEARHPVIFVDTYEDVRFVHELLRIKNDDFIVKLNGNEIKLITDYESNGGVAGPDFSVQLTNIRSAVKAQMITINLFKYIDISDSDSGKERAIMIKDSIPLLNASKQILMFIGPNPTVSTILSRDHMVFNFSLMDSDDIRKYVESYVNQMSSLVKQASDSKTWSQGKMVSAKNAYVLDYSDDEYRKIAMSATGLTKNEITLAFSDSLKEKGKLDHLYVQGAKRDMVEKSGLLEWHTPIPIDNIGGLDNIKEWIDTRAPAIYDIEAQKYGLKPPRGIVILGASGTGKSLISKAIASKLNVSLIALVMGKIMDRFVGGSEGNMINALNIISANAPCVLWVDEVEKALAGVQSSGFSDSGTFARVFGILLTWLQERESPVFLVATCNAMLGSNNQLMIPPEFQRKGRMDEIWWVDVPNKEESIEIYKIQLMKVKRDPTLFDLDMLSDTCFAPSNTSEKHRYTGAEIESAVMDAMFTAYTDNKREVTSNDIAKSLLKSVPMSYFMRETLDKLRAFGVERCRPASKYNSNSQVLSAGSLSVELNQIHI